MVYLYERSEGWVATLFALKLILAEDLMRPVLNEGLKVGSMIEEHIAYLPDDMGGFLTLMQRFDQPLTDSVNVLHVPEDLCDKVFFSVLWNGKAFSNAFGPRLRHTHTRSACMLALHSTERWESAHLEDTPCRVGSRVRCR